MGKNNEKGKKYELFSQEILLLKHYNWDYSKKEKNIIFDKISDNHKIMGISGEEHQIDVHLLSSEHEEYHLLCECKAHDPAVEKTHACSFVTVINDIKAYHKDWKIIPVFTADDGFQSGAKKILQYYGIIYLEMKDYRNAKRTLTTTITSRAPKFSELRGILDDGTVVDKDVCLQNYSRGCCGLTNAINSFELLDKNNNIIEDLIDFVGDFHTGKRIIMFDEYDDFFELHSEKELIRIEGTVVENITTNYGSDQTVFESKAVTNIILGDGSIYRINKDGSCIKFDDEGEAKRIFK